MDDITDRDSRLRELGFEDRELLYRSAAETDLRPDRREVSAGALRQPPGGLSCDRSARRPHLEDVFSPTRPDETLIAEMQPAATLLRERIPGRDDEYYRVEPRPVPLPDSEAHCEVRAFRESRGWNDDWRPGDSTKLQVRVHLARTMHLRPERYRRGSDGRWHREP